MSTRSRSSGKLLRNIVMPTSLLLAIVGVLVYWHERKVELRWEEEVLLSNHDLVIADFRGRYHDSWYPGLPVQYRIHDLSLSIRGSALVKPPPPWQGRLRPILIDRAQSGQGWIVVVMFDYCQDWHAMGRPAAPFLQYQYVDSAWAQVPLSEEFLDRSANLLFVNPSRLPLLRASGFKLTIQTKDSVFSRPRYNDRLSAMALTWRRGC